MRNICVDNDLTENELKSENCEDIEIELLYEENFINQGLGAIVVFAPGQWRFDSLSQLTKFRQTKIHESFFKENQQYQSNNIIDLVQEIAQLAPRQFVMIRMVWGGIFDKFLCVKVVDRLSETEIDRVNKSICCTKNSSESSEIKPKEEYEQRRIALLLKIDIFLANMTYAQGCAASGRGAVISNHAGKFRFASLAQLARLEQCKKIAGNIVFSNESLIDLVQQCPPDRFIVLCEIYKPFYPFGKTLLIFKEELHTKYVQRCLGI